MEKENRDGAIPLRVKPSVKTKLEDIAWRNKSSLNNLLNDVLEKFIELDDN